MTRPHPIATRIKELRMDRKLTQADLAAGSGVGEKTISSFETGDRIASLKVAQLAALCAALGVTIQGFFLGIGNTMTSARMRHYCNCEQHLCSSTPIAGKTSCETCSLRLCMRSAT